ncbi:hypothetical protein ACWGH5_29345 [Streptomyces sp. NPDC054864]
MTGNDAPEQASSEVPVPQSAKAVDDQLIEELVGRARAEGLQLAGEVKRCLTGVDEMVISLAAKGLTTGEVQAHLAEV